MENENEKEKEKENDCGQRKLYENGESSCTNVPLGYRALMNIGQIRETKGITNISFIILGVLE